MILQVRQHRIEKIILAGLVGNLCVEAQMRDFIEHGFEVAMVRDATAGTSNEEGDGYRAALFSPRSAVSQLPWVIAIVSRVEAGGSACHRLHFMVCRSHQTLKFFFRQNWKFLSKGRLGAGADGR